MITDSQKLIKDFLSEQDVSKNTKKNYYNILQAWVSWLILNGISWGEMRKPHIIKYKNDLNDKKRSPLYINTCLSVFRKFYNWMDDSGFYPNISTGITGFKLYKGFRKKPLTPEQVDSLLKSIDLESKTGIRDHLIIRMMVTSGLRSVEISRLDVGDFEDGNHPGLRVLGKGRKEKTFIRISSTVVTELKTYLGKRIQNESSPIFLVWEGGLHQERMSPGYIGITIKSLMKRAGMDDKMLSAHSLRHTTAVMMINQGANLYDVQMQLRHTDANMTRNYLRFIEEEKRRELEWVDRLDTSIQKTGQTIIHFKND